MTDLLALEPDGWRKEFALGLVAQAADIVAIESGARTGPTGPRRRSTMPLVRLLVPAGLLGLTSPLLRSSRPAIKVSAAVGQAGERNVEVTKELESLTTLPDEGRDVSLAGRGRVRRCRRGAQDADRTAQLDDLRLRKSKAVNAGRAWTMAAEQGKPP